ncbi:ATP-binding protein [Streptomyces lancefieldiae]|uniref:Helix-turn-helix domain-containing protein n=1 Tax=Streptomyces lancefieldiae TaxID=3075520 RepID=A0ABU3B016_9ACTN|nr:helix-turn-helix domain-containing protein [Streptomyces sp. DSM 40712]MDT0615787.1 helix-turn-helix domain-containing protein [Streptomyces sp. DSM 40712]
MAEVGGAGFGALLRQLRLEASLTIEALAEASGVSVRGIGDLERGRRATPQRGTVAALANGLGLDEAARERLLAAARSGRNPRHGAVGVRAFPRGITDFVGRKVELAHLAALAGRAAVMHPVVVAVSGPPGAGKTTLALHAARGFAEHFPDGQLMLDLRGLDDSPPDTAELMLRVLKALGVADRDLAKAGPQGHPELYRQVLAERRCLLVLDNARDESQVRPLLPGAGAGMVVITSRRMLTGLESVHRLPIGELSPADAAAFLTALVGQERADADPVALAEVARRCAHLPLALRVAGNWLGTRTGWTVRRLADRLALEERRLDTLAAGDLRLSAAFDLSYRQLTPTAARLFRLLSLVDGPEVSAAGAAQLTGQPLFDAEDTLEELVETGLLGTDRDRYRLHDLLRLFARSRLHAEEPSENSEAARSTLHRWLLETAVVAGRWYEPDHGAPPATWQATVDLSTVELAGQWLQDEGDNWLAALRAAATAGDHTTVVEVTEALHWFSDQWVFWGHWPEVFRTAAHCAQALGDPLLEATHLNYHAWALLLCEGRHHDSLARAAQALAAAQRADHLPQQGWAHFYSAWALGLLGDHAAAADHNHESALLFEAAGDLHGTLQAMTSTAYNLLLADRHEESLAEDLRALAFLDQAGDRIEPHIADFARANLEMNIGRSHTCLKNWPEAADHLRAAVNLGRNSGNKGLESRALTRLGDALLAAGHRDEARDAFTRCVSLGTAADPSHLTEARERLSALGTLGAPPRTVPGSIARRATGTEYPSGPPEPRDPSAGSGG